MTIAIVWFHSKDIKQHSHVGSRHAHNGECNAWRMRREKWRFSGAKRRAHLTDGTATMHAGNGGGFHGLPL